MSPLSSDRPASAVAEPWTARQTLAGGEQILLRDVTPADEPLLLTLLQHVTGDSRWMRFFTGGPNIDQAAAAEADCDGVQRFGILALSEDGTAVLGHGMCVPAGPGAAEIAFEVVDGYHRHGIGGVLLEHLVGRARTAGFERLVAEVLPENRDMLDLLIASGMEMTGTTSDGVRHVSIPLDATTAAAARPPGD